MSGLNLLRQKYPDHLADLNDYEAVNKIAELTGQKPDAVASDLGVQMPTVAREFAKGISSGVDQIQGSLYGAGALAADLVGADRVRDWAMEGAQRNQMEAQETAAAVDDIRKIGGLRDGALWASHVVGAQVPQLVGSLTPAGLGARYAGKKALASALEQGLSKEAAQAAATRAGALGAYAGGGAYGATMESGDNFLSIYARTGEYQPGNALAHGVPAGALEGLSDRFLLKGVGAGRPAGMSRTAYVGQQAGQQAAISGVLEEVPQDLLAQHALDVAAPGYEYDGWRTANAAAAGAVGGGVIGGGFAALTPSEKTYAKVGDVARDPVGAVINKAYKTAEEAGRKQAREDISAGRTPTPFQNIQAEELQRRQDEAFFEPVGKDTDDATLSANMKREADYWKKKILTAQPHSLGSQEEALRAASAQYGSDGDWMKYRGELKKHRIIEERNSLMDTFKPEGAKFSEMTPEGEELTALSNAWLKNEGKAYGPYFDDDSDSAKALGAKLFGWIKADFGKQYTENGDIFIPRAFIEALGDRAPGVVQSAITAARKEGWDIKDAGDAVKAVRDYVSSHEGDTGFLASALRYSQQDNWTPKMIQRYAKELRQSGGRLDKEDYKWFKSQVTDPVAVLEHFQKPNKFYKAENKLGMKSDSGLTKAAREQDENAGITDNDGDWNSGVSDAEPSTKRSYPKFEEGEFFDLRDPEQRALVEKKGKLAAGRDREATLNKVVHVGILDRTLEKIAEERGQAVESLPKQTRDKVMRDLVHEYFPTFERLPPPPKNVSEFTLQQYEKRKADYEVALKRRANLLNQKIVAVAVDRVGMEKLGTQIEARDVHMKNADVRDPKYGAHKGNLILRTYNKEGKVASRPFLTSTQMIVAKMFQAKDSNGASTKRYEGTAQELLQLLSDGITSLVQDPRFGGDKKAMKIGTLVNGEQRWFDASDIRKWPQNLVLFRDKEGRPHTLGEAREQAALQSKNTLSFDFDPDDQNYGRNDRVREKKVWEMREDLKGLLQIDTEKELRGRIVMALRRKDEEEIAELWSELRDAGTLNASGTVTEVGTTRGNQVEEGQVGPDNLSAYDPPYIKRTDEGRMRSKSIEAEAQSVIGTPKKVSSKGSTVNLLGKEVNISSGVKSLTNDEGMLGEKRKYIQRDADNNIVPVYNFNVAAEKLQAAKDWVVSTMRNGVEPLIAAIGKMDLAQLRITDAALFGRETVTARKSRVSDPNVSVQKVDPAEVAALVKRTGVSEKVAESMLRRGDKTVHTRVYDKDIGGVRTREAGEAQTVTKQVGLLDLHQTKLAKQYFNGSLRDALAFLGAGRENASTLRRVIDDRKDVIRRSEAEVEGVRDRASDQVRQADSAGAEAGVVAQPGRERATENGELGAGQQGRATKDGELNDGAAQQLQAYLDQHGSKNAVWAAAARNALASGNEKQIAGALAAAKKQFGELAAGQKVELKEQASDQAKQDAWVMKVASMSMKDMRAYINALPKEKLEAAYDLIEGFNPDNFKSSTQERVAAEALDVLRDRLSEELWRSAPTLNLDDLPPHATVWSVYKPDANGDGASAYVASYRDMGTAQARAEAEELTLVNETVKDATKGRMRGRLGAEDGGAKYSMMSTEIHNDLGKTGFAATHDSPIRHEGKFNWREHTGKGEGHAAFGAGTYLSTADGVHAAYKKKFTAQISPLTDAQRAKYEAKLEALKDNPDAAELRADYEQALAEDRQHRNTFKAGAASTYHVTVNIKPEQLLDWDAPLSEQSDLVRSALRNAKPGTPKSNWVYDGKDTYVGEDGFSIVRTKHGFSLIEYGETDFGTFDTLDAAKAEGAAVIRDIREANGAFDEKKSNNYGIFSEDEMWEPYYGTTGERVYKELVKKLGSQAAASDYLQSLGILGHKYAAAGGRNDKHPNYVIYDDSKIETNYVHFNKQNTTPSDQATITPEQALADIARMLGKDYDAQVVADLGGKAGQWTPHGIKLAAAAPNGTQYHEALHELFSQLRKHGAENVVKVIERVTQNPIIMRKLEQLLEGHPKAIEQLKKPEEAAAFLFQFWNMGLINIGPETKTLFQTIKDWLVEVAKDIHAIINNAKRDERKAEKAQKLDEQKVRDLFDAFASGVAANPDSRQALYDALRKNAEVHQKTIDELGMRAERFWQGIGRYVISSESMLNSYSKHPELKIIADAFHQMAGKSMKNMARDTSLDARGGFFEATHQESQRRLAKFERFLERGNYDQKDFEIALKYLESGKGNSSDAKIAKLVDFIRDYYSEMFDYITKSDVRRLDPTSEQRWMPVEKRKNYWSQVWNVEALVDNHDGFVADLLAAHPRELQHMADEANKEIEAWEKMTNTTGKVKSPTAQAEIDKKIKEFNESGQIIGKVTYDKITPEAVAETIYTRLINSMGMVDMQETEWSLGITPGASAVNRRQLDWLDKEVFSKYKSKDLVNIVTTYTRTMVKRAESQKRFGYGGERISDAVDTAFLREMGGQELVDEAVAELPEAIKQWKKEAAEWHEDNQDLPYPEPYPTLRLVGVEAHRAKVGAEASNKALIAAEEALRPVVNAIRAQEGTLGNEISPTMRAANSWINTYTNIRLLPFALFTNLSDVIGITAQGGTLGDAWNAFVGGMREVRNTWINKKGDDSDTLRAEDWGVVDAGLLLDTLGQSYGSVYMTHKAQRINNRFFRIIGMEGWNRGIRVTATKVGERIISDWATKGVDFSKPGEKSRFERLYGKGANPKAIKLDSQGRLDTSNAANRAAIQRFVQDAVMSSNAAHRTFWMSDPRFATFAHLKNYAYTFHSVMLKNIIDQGMQGNLRPALVAGLGYASIAIAAGAVKEMLIPGDEPFWMKGGLDGYIDYGLGQANLGGVPQLWAEGVTDLDPAKLAGPFWDQLQNLVSSPLPGFSLNLSPFDGDTEILRDRKVLVEMARAIPPATLTGRGMDSLVGD